MKLFFNQKGSPRSRIAGEAGVVNIIPLFLILVGIVGGVYLVKHPQIFKPKAAGDVLEIQSMEGVDEKGRPCRLYEEAGKKKTNCPSVRLKILSPQDVGITTDASFKLPNISLIKPAFADEGNGYNLVGEKCGSETKIHNDKNEEISTCEKGSTCRVAQFNKFLGFESGQNSFCVNVYGSPIIEDKNWECRNNTEIQQKGGVADFFRTKIIGCPPGTQCAVSDGRVQCLQYKEVTNLTPENEKDIELDPSETWIEFLWAGPPSKDINYRFIIDSSEDERKNIVPSGKCPSDYSDHLMCIEEDSEIGNVFLPDYGINVNSFGGGKNIDLSGYDFKSDATYNWKVEVVSDGKVISTSKPTSFKIVKKEVKSENNGSEKEEEPKKTEEATNGKKEESIDNQNALSDYDKATKDWTCKDNKIVRELKDGKEVSERDCKDIGPCWRYWNPDKRFEGGGIWDAFCKGSNDCKAVESSCSVSGTTKKLFCISKDNCQDPGKVGCYETKELADTELKAPTIEKCTSPVSGAGSIGVGSTSSNSVSSAVGSINSSTGTTNTSSVAGINVCNNTAAIALPDAGANYRWVPKCDSSCNVSSDNSGCAQYKVTNSGFICPSTSYWCYDFGGDVGKKCLQLEHIESNASSQGPAAPASDQKCPDSVGVSQNLSAGGKIFFRVAEDSVDLPNAERMEYTPGKIINYRFRSDPNRGNIINSGPFNTKFIHIRFENEKGEIIKIKGQDYFVAPGVEYVKPT